MVAALCVVVAAMAGCGGEADLPGEGSVTEDAELRAELTRVYGALRKALAEYDMEAAKVHLDVPAGVPTPTRAQALAMAEFLPDVARCRVVEVRRLADRAAFYMETELDDETSAAVAVIRFRKGESGWMLAPAPHTLNEYSALRSDGATVPKIIAEEPSLTPFPEPAESDLPAPPAGPVGDERPDADIRPELEALWGRIRDALARGAVEEASADIELTDGRTMLPAEEAPALVSQMPDLAKCSFLKLGWRRDKPRIVGYNTEGDLDDAGRSTVILIVFVRPDDRWKFAPGPTSIEKVTVEKTDREGLLRLIETDRRLQL